MLVRRSSEPFRDLSVLRRQMDELFNRSWLSFFDSEEGEAISAWAPTMDVIEHDDHILLRAELPGLTRDDVELTVENNTLSIRGDKKFEYSTEEGQYRRIESRFGSFYRSFTLPTTVDQDRIEANFKNGVLEIRLPKVEQAKPKKIAVKVH